MPVLTPARSAGSQQRTNDRAATLSDRHLCFAGELGGKILPAFAPHFRKVLSVLALA